MVKVVERNEILLIFSFFLPLLVLSLSSGLVVAVPCTQTQSCAESSEGSIETTSPNLTSGVQYPVQKNPVGNSCSSNSDCQSGYCCSNICSASACPSEAPAAVTGAAGGAPTTTVTEEVTPTPIPTPTPLPAITPVPVTAVDIPVTQTEQVQEIIKGVEAADLGIAEVTAENVEVRQIGVAETTIAAAQVQTVIDSALTTATTAEAKKVLTEIKDAVSAGASAGITITPRLEVFEVKAKDTGKTIFVSKVKLELKPEKDVKDVSIVETIPKSVAASIAEIVFTGLQPKVLQSDPVVQWEFAEVKAGETKDLSYLVKKKLTQLEVSTVAAATPVVPTIVPPPPPVDLTAVYIIIAIAVVLAVVWKLGMLKMPSGRPKKYQWRR